MPKLVLILSFCLLIFKIADAQKTAIVYYIKNSKLVPGKDSADYSIQILPPDTSADKNLFIVRIYSSTGKIRLIGGSLTGNLNLKFQGPIITFFSNGGRMRIANYSNGLLVGDVIENYPNGKLYHIKRYALGKPAYLLQCNDSTGNVMAENGNGNWINYLDEAFNGVYSKGEIKNGLEEGEWQGELQNEYFNYKYQKGILVSFTFRNKESNNISVYDPVFPLPEYVPEYPGGLEALGTFLAKNVRYPHTAVTENVQGRVIISFIVEADGRMTNIKVVRGIGGGCDEEALRVAKLLQRWKPGIQNNRAVRVSYSVPISFTLNN